jgi:hypothetical protein
MRGRRFLFDILTTLRDDAMVLTCDRCVSGWPWWGTIAVLLVTNGTAVADEPTRLPKYGAGAVRLFDAREYLRTHEAPDFWALMPYYVSQPNDRSCSAASVAMLVNAVRADRTLWADEPLATVASVLENVDRHQWRDQLGPDGPGVTLDELAAIVRQILSIRGLKPARVEVLRFPGESEDALARLRQVLIANEQSALDFVLVNFLQSVVTGDPEGNAGHIAPVAAYDAEKRRILLLDPDRQWYEPYWVPEEMLLRAMATEDSASGQLRGLLYIVVGRE